MSRVSEAINRTRSAVWRDSEATRLYLMAMSGEAIDDHRENLTVHGQAPVGSSDLQALDPLAGCLARAGSTRCLSELPARSLVCPTGLLLARHRLTTFLHRPYPSITLSRARGG